VLSTHSFHGARATQPNLKRRVTKLYSLKLSLTCRFSPFVLVCVLSAVLIASMVSTRVQKRKMNDSNPLYEVGILQQVLGHVGPGEWLFLATVSSLWRHLYAKLADVEMQTPGIYKTDFICAPKMTLYSSIFTSPSRVRLAREHGIDSSEDSYKLSAGMHGAVKTLAAAAYEADMSFSAVTMLGAAECNELSVVQFLRARGCAWDWKVSGAAARRGNFEMLRWVRLSGCDWKPQYILGEAASSGNIEMTAWVKQQPGVVCDEYAMAAAAQNGHTAMCEYLRAEEYPWGKDACHDAARNGHVDTLKWLHEHGCPWHARTVCEEAAEGGSVDVMEYLQQEGLMETAVVLTNMLNAAGACNNLAAAQWLRQQGAPWPAVLRYAGNAWAADTKAWARRQGCRAPTRSPLYGLYVAKVRNIVYI
jgi:Ankyrin repeats (3 copies)